MDTRFDYDNLLNCIGAFMLGAGIGFIIGAAAGMTLFAFAYAIGLLG